jgi:hypothetical protein
MDVHPTKNVSIGIDPHPVDNQYRIGTSKIVGVDSTDSSSKTLGLKKHIGTGFGGFHPSLGYGRYNNMTTMDGSWI